ncbi:putative myosin-binding protein 5 [Sesamum alatum]|uniref:Myosin-binding protein 5 n=1 Tax=Sesamum alatum TaxID=300844 RepID=A0AAE1YBJ1_9LAMI|nr:putative myosin-binding protein 5 [Sesamum alatum]
MPMEALKTLLEERFEEGFETFPNFLIYAVLEWVMIILLFVDGLLAFISNELAKFFGLQIPCLLCTRIDHVLVHRHSSFYYNDSMCEVHKKDISSLAYCHMHKKLSDIRNMCQGCLLSFATGKESDCEKYKSLVGILHKDIDFTEDERKLLAKPVKKDDADVYDEKSSDVPRCSCCEEPLKVKSATKFMRSLSMNAPAPSPRASWLSRNEEGRNMELPPSRYAELKFTSDTDSEIPEDDSSNVENQAGKEDVKDKTAPPPLPPPADSEEVNEDTTRTPSFARGNKFFGIPFDSAALLSPRWINRSMRKPSMDRIDFTMEPNDQASALNEVDGDTLNRLKRQVRVDHKSLMALYMELDEERSASAIAANNAMAMITRLQAEKAAVQMEALQYQRMMEEQAEYDQEALQIMRDILVKRDQDVKALESELEAYREKYGHIRKLGSEICEMDADEDYQEMKSQAVSSFSEKSDYISSYGADQNESERTYGRPMENGGGNQEESYIDFEGERSYLLGLLTDLEEKVKINEGSNSSELATIKDDEEGEGNKNKVTLTREVSLMKERLRAIEADSGFLKQAAMTLQRGGEGTKLLAEIAQHLRDIRHSVKSPSNNTDA